MAVNWLAAPLFAAGFYYKTFMGPTRGAWMFYEPFIRRPRASGEAASSAIPTATRPRMNSATCWSSARGPAGLAAALAAAQSGARTVIVEQDSLRAAACCQSPRRVAAAAWLDGRCRVGALPMSAHDTHDGLRTL